MSLLETQNFLARIYTDENLRREFAEKLKDKTFAENPFARLNFFFERSPYVDKNIGLYPVGRIISNVPPSR